MIEYITNGNDDNGLCSKNQKLWQIVAGYGEAELWIDVKHGHAQLGFLEEKERSIRRIHELGERVDVVVDMSKQ